MLRNFLCSICLLILILANTYPQQKWVPFLSQEKSSPSVNLTTSTKNNVSFTITINGMFTDEQKFKEKLYTRITIPDADVETKEGSPQVPMITKVIAIPDCENVSISIVPSNDLHFSNYNLLPAPKYIKKKLQNGEYGNDILYEENKTVYSSFSDFPGKYGEIIETGYCRDQKIARVVIYPLQFNPASKSIKAYTNFNINLYFNNPTSEINKELGIFRNMMHHVAINYELNGINASSNSNEIIRITNLGKTAPLSVKCTHLIVQIFKII